MSPFLRKIKNSSASTDREEESAENESSEPEKENEEIKTEAETEEEESPKKPEAPKRTVRKPSVKKLSIQKNIVKEKPAEPLKEPQKPAKEMKVTKIYEQEKTGEKKWPEPEGQLAVDVYQTDGELVIRATIAGVKPEDLDITAQGDTVIIRGKREEYAEKKEKNYFYQECYWGSFSREIILPVEADISRTEATMTDGVLVIRMPKIEKEKRKKITVR